MLGSDEECLHYAYLDLSQYNEVDGGDAVRPDGQEPAMETNRDILLPLDSPKLAQVCVYCSSMSNVLVYTQECV